LLQALFDLEQNCIARFDLPFIKSDTQSIPPQPFSEFARGGFVLPAGANENVVLKLFGHASASGKVLGETVKGLGQWSDVV
jgi:hypothetical protein